MKYRNRLPQLSGKKMITDGGLETCLVFHENIDLPLFASFKAFDTEAGRKAIDEYMNKFAKLAIEQGHGFIMDTPTWRASSRWGDELGLSEGELIGIHKASIRTLSDLRKSFETETSPFVINGVIGPHDDGYSPKARLSIEQAAEYHRNQPMWFADFGADMITAMTLTYSEEAIGIAQAAKSASMPVVISFTVETDGCLPSGETLANAIEAVDRSTNSYPAYFMINCAHPDHFSNILEGAWTKRIMGLRANASRLSHAELNECDTLDDGDPKELGALYRELSNQLPNLNVLGGCCGTDHRHVQEMCLATYSSQPRI